MYDYAGDMCACCGACVRLCTYVSPCMCVVVKPGGMEIPNAVQRPSLLTYADMCVGLCAGTSADPHMKRNLRLTVRTHARTHTRLGKRPGERAPTHTHTHISIKLSWRIQIIGHKELYGPAYQPAGIPTKINKRTLHRLRGVHGTWGCFGGAALRA